MITPLLKAQLTIKLTQWTRTSRTKDFSIYFIKKVLKNYFLSNAQLLTSFIKEKIYWLEIELDQEKLSLLVFPLFRGFDIKNGKASYQSF
jgi:hypothetical protein